jgi:hypothetical protein
METLEIKNSSAISQINFEKEESIVGICYTSSSKVYEFYCEDFESVKEQIINAHEKAESVGKLINSLRKDGSLETIILEETNEPEKT